MIKISWLRLFFFLIYCIVNDAAASELPKAKDWRGRYAFAGPHAEDFYELPAIRDAVIQLVGERRYHLLASWNTFTPIDTDGDSMVIAGCKPHDCSEYSAATLIEGGKISVCLFEESTLYWFLSGQKVPLTRAGDNQHCNFVTIELARQSLAAMFSRGRE
jgi:hypothetical protein